MSTLRLILVLLCLALTAACVPTPKRNGAADVFQLGISNTATPGYAVLEATLSIARPSAQAGYDSRAIVYSSTPYRLNHYRNSRWVDTPARMIESALAAGFERSGLFQAVLRGGSGQVGTYRLNTEIVQLRQVFQEGSSSSLELSLHVQLSERGAGGLAASKLIQISVPAPSEDAQGAVHAANAALEKAVLETVAFVADTLGATAVGAQSSQG